MTTNYILNHSVQTRRKFSFGALATALTGAVARQTAEAREASTTIPTSLRTDGAAVGRIFIGSYPRHVAESRIEIPGEFCRSITARNWTGIGVVPSILDNCLQICDFSWIESLCATIGKSASMGHEHREAIALLIIGQAHTLNIDQDGCASLPQSLLSMMNFQDEALLIGCGKYFQVWRPDNWRTHAMEIRSKALEDRCRHQAKASL